MNRLGRRTAWLGWVVAGVLALSAGGVAFAANNSGDRATDTAPVRNLGLLFAQTQGSQGDSTQGKLPGLRHRLFGGRLGGRVLHSETTVQTDNGVKTYVAARGDVTALSASSITITSSDKVATTFAINSDTRYGFQDFKQPQAALRTGQTAMVIGTKSGDTTTANRIITSGS